MSSFMKFSLAGELSGLKRSAHVNNASVAICLEESLVLIVALESKSRKGEKVKR